MASVPGWERGPQAKGQAPTRTRCGRPRFGNREVETVVISPVKAPTESST